MKKVLVLFLVAVFVSAMVLGACGNNQAPAAPADTGGTEAPASDAPATAPADGEAIKIGALLDYTGPAADIGPKAEAGINLALDEVNWEIAGRPVEVVTADSATDVTAAVERFKDLVDRDGIKLIIGPLMGDSQLAISPVAKEKDVIFTSLVNGMWDNIELSGNRMINFPTTVEAQTYPMGTWAYDQGYRTMATVGANYSGKIGFVEGVVKGFEDAGGEVVSKVWTDLGTDDYSGYIATLPKIDDVDVLLYALEGPMAVSRFVYQVREANYNVPLITITQSEDYTPEVLAELGEIALGIPGQSAYTWQLDNPENKYFVDAIQNYNGGVLPSGTENNGYVLMKVMIEALNKTGGDMSYDVLWPAITSIVMQTPAGKLSFGPEGIAVTDFYVTEAEKAADGTFQLSAPLYTVPQITDWRLN